MVQNIEDIRLCNGLNMISPIQGVQGDNVTKSDTDILSPGVLYVGSSGDIKVRLISGSVLTFKNISGGCFLPIVIDMVYATDTTATDIIIIR